MKNKVILITGATGLIGSHLVKALLKEGASVIAVGRNENKLKRVFEEELKNRNFSVFAHSITDALPSTVGEVDYIFHAASPISGAEIRSNPVDVIDANLVGVRNCLEYLKYQNETKNKNGRLIVFSSATVYGNKWIEEKTLSECSTDTADALDAGNAPYSEAKRMVEVISRAYHAQCGVESVIVRIAYVYGPVTSAPNTAFYEFIGKAVNGEDIVLNNSGMARRDNIYVEDVVNGLITVAQHGIASEAYNISSNGDLGNYAAIDEIADVIAVCANQIMPDKNIQVHVKQNNGFRNPGFKMDNTKLKNLGWNVETDLHNGIMHTIKSFLA